MMTEQHLDEKEIIKTFLDMGTQISTEALVLIKENPMWIINQIKAMDKKPFLLTDEDVKVMLTSRVVDMVKDDVTLVRRFSFDDRKPIKMNDYVNHFLSRYEKMKSLIAENNLEKLMSINKINENTTNFSVIGIVLEKSPSMLILEDPTGEIEIVFEGLVKQKIAEIEQDDVIGIFCKKISGKYQASKVVFPDIPLKREVKRSIDEAKILVTKRQANGSREGMIIINVNDINEPILEEVKGLTVLIIPKKFFQSINASVTSEHIQTILKKRHLYPPFLNKFSFGPDNFVLEETPDIVISDLEPRFYKNYKGTTIISNPDETADFVINLKTRDVEEIAVQA